MAHYRPPHTSAARPRHAPADPRRRSLSPLTSPAQPPATGPRRNPRPVSMRMSGPHGVTSGSTSRSRVHDRDCRQDGSERVPSRRAQHPPPTGREASTLALASLPSRTSSGTGGGAPLLVRARGAEAAAESQRRLIAISRCRPPGAATNGAERRAIAVHPRRLIGSRAMARWGTSSAARPLPAAPRTSRSSLSCAPRSNAAKRS